MTNQPAFDFVPPWETGRPSLYEYIQSHKNGGELPVEGMALPDDERYAQTATHNVVWGPGGLDGMISHHTLATPNRETLDAFDRAIRRLLANPNAASIADLYALAVGEGNLLTIIDDLKQRIYDAPPGNLDLLHDFAYWLATSSPDRNLVKIGIALLGVFTTPHDEELLTLGLHDEFTLYALIALQGGNTPEQAESLAWDLAQRVHGWGRVFAVEHLAQSVNRDIKRWLVREGYRNSVMIEYVAYPCAAGGELAAQLRVLTDDGMAVPEPDKLLIGAVEILTAFFNGSPSGGMVGYEEGAEAVELLLSLMETAGWGDPRFLLFAAGLRDFVADAEQNWDALEADGWTEEKKRDMAERASAFMARPEWPGTLSPLLEKTSAPGFALAATAAERLGIDTWPYRFRRQRDLAADAESDEWSRLLETTDPERLNEVLRLAEQKVDLAAVELGVDTEPEVGPFRFDALDNILYGLQPFPGKGWNFVRASLRSPIVRRRNLALQALAAWDRFVWPDDAENELRRMQDVETDEFARKRLQLLLGHSD